MNPFNILINYLIADSRAKHYNVTDTQKVKNTAVLIGAFSQNPIVDYLVIDNQAKNLQSTTNQIANATTANSNSSSVTGTNIANTTDTDIKELAIKIDEIISQNTEIQNQIGILQTNDKNLSDNISELKGITKNNSDEINKIWERITEYVAIKTSKQNISTENESVSQPKKIEPKTK